MEPDKKHFDAQRTRYESTADTEAPKIAAHFSSIYADLVDVGITVRHSTPSHLLGIPVYRAFSSLPGECEW